MTQDQSPTPPLTPYQIALAKTYAQGEFAWILDIRDWQNFTTDSVDTLFRFLMFELSHGEGCIDLQTALKRLQTAADHIEEVYDAIETLRDGEHEPPSPETPACSEKRIIATFVPQVWVNDHAVTCDPLGETRFDVTDAILAMGQTDALQLRDDDMGTDNLAQLPNAPDWIKNWPGPFYVAVEAAIASYFGTLTNPDGEPNRQAT